MTAPLRLEAPAKLNLDLRVLDRRSNGFHELESTVVLLAIADRLLLMPGCSGFRLDGGDVADLPPDATNLAWRGLEAGLGGPPDLACLTLEKRIPVAAGLGGGSSDAAAAWRLGRAWHGLAEVPTRDELEALSAIGADVPFFAAGAAAARVRGIGERIEPLEAITSQVVLVHPPFGLRTADVFAALRPEEWGTASNDLEASARRLRPELDDLFALVRSVGGVPRMTGSGPTIFAIDDDPERADALAQGIAEHGVRATRTATLTRPTAIESIDEGPQEDDE
jgi:4-diphosphocytidyl-2-C-methyl-D-erythritol kinase